MQVFSKSMKFTILTYTFGFSHHNPSLQKTLLFYGFKEDLVPPHYLVYSKKMGLSRLMLCLTIPSKVNLKTMTEITPIAAAANAEIREAQNGSILCPNFHN